MDIVTDSFDKITLVQLQNKLSQKFEQLNKLKSKKALKRFTRRDYIEQTKTDANAKVISNRNTTVKTLLDIKV